MIGSSPASDLLAVTLAATARSAFSCQLVHVWLVSVAPISPSPFEAPNHLLNHKQAHPLGHCRCRNDLRWRGRSSRYLVTNQRLPQRQVDHRSDVCPITLRQQKQQQHKSCCLLHGAPESFLFSLWSTVFPGS